MDRRLATFFCILGVIEGIEERLVLIAKLKRDERQFGIREELIAVSAESKATLILNLCKKVSRVPLSVVAIVYSLQAPQHTEQRHKLY